MGALAQQIQETRSKDDLKEVNKRNGKDTVQQRCENVLDKKRSGV